MSNYQVLKIINTMTVIFFSYIKTLKRFNVKFKLSDYRRFLSLKSQEVLR